MRQARLIPVLGCHRGIIHSSESGQYFLNGYRHNRRKLRERMCMHSLIGRSRRRNERTGRYGDSLFPSARRLMLKSAYNLVQSPSSASRSRIHYCHRELMCARKFQLHAGLGAASQAPFINNPAFDFPCFC